MVLNMIDASTCSNFIYCRDQPQKHEVQIRQSHDDFERSAGDSILSAIDYDSDLLTSAG